MSGAPGLSPGLPPGPAHRRRTIAFTSGKGGVGKSSIALNTALSLARRGHRVAILDGDLGLASLTVLLGTTPRVDLADVLAGERRLADILIRGPHDLLLVPAGAGVAELACLGAEEHADLLAQLRELEDAVEFLLIDTGAGISPTVLALILAAQEAVVITLPEPTALADAYAVMKVVVREHPAYPFHVLVNMARDAAQAEQVYASLTQVALRFLGYRPGYAGWVGADPSVTRSVVRQVPFTLLAPDSAASRDVAALAARLSGQPARAAGAEPSFWRRVSDAARRRP